MIKFFRKIRKNLLSEGKTGKYFKYAFGEIILVVIGILIALQINNWNELRKKENNEMQLYQKIIGDLNAEYQIIEIKIRDLNSHQNLHFQLYDESQGKAEYDPTVIYNQLFYISGAEMFFNDNHSKSLSFITDDQTHEILKKYIQLEKITTTGSNEWNEIKTEKIRPFLAKHGIKNTKEVFNIKSSDDWFSVSTAQLISYPKLIEQYGTNEFDQLLFALRFHTTWLLDNLNILKESNREFEVFLRNKFDIVDQNKVTQLSAPIDVGLLSEDKTVDEIIEIISNENPDNPIYDISENALTNFGYDLITERKLNDSRKIFEIGIELYPNAFNMYDSYGECLFKLKDYENATKAFKKALELNPESVNSKRMLEYLKTKG